MNILIVTDGIPGHENQSLGLVKSLQKHTKNLTFTLHKIEYKYPIFRSLSIVLQRYLVKSLTNKNCERIISIFKPISSLEKVDIIITTGGKCAFLVAARQINMQKNLFKMGL